MKKLLIMFFFTLLLASCSEETNSEKIKNEASELDQRIGNSIMDNFGYRNEFVGDAVKLVEFDKKTGKMTIIAYTYGFEDETYEEFKADTLESCANVLKDVKRQNEVLEVDLIIETTLEDLQGNPMDYAIFNMVFERKNLIKINFNELDSLLLYKKANFYIETPINM